MKNLKLFMLLVGATFSIVKCDHANPDFSKLCKSGVDLDCARKYFRKNGHCAVVKHAKDSVEYEEIFPVYLPKIDLTVVATKTYVSQMDGVLEQFYLDKKTGNLVMSVNFSSKGIKCDAPDAVFAISQKGEEPKVFKEYVNATYPIILTAVIPASDGITVESLKMAKYFAYFPYKDAPISIGPKLTKSQDSVIKAGYEGLLTNLPLALKEIFSTAASFFMLAYLQNNVCDFKLGPVIEGYDLSVLAGINEVKEGEDHTELLNPCDKSDDVANCVRNYFDEQSTCSVVKQPDEKPAYREIFINRMPSINSSVVLTKSELSGLNGEIETFYINKQTNNLVMTVAFNSVRMSTPLFHLFLHQKGSQPKIISDYSTVNYPITVSAVIPIGEGLTADSLKNAFVSNYLRDSLTFEIGPSLGHSDDPKVKKIVQDLIADPNTVAKELAVTEGLDFFLSYIQMYICDFGIPHAFSA